jgi:hypothetical protein
MQVFVLLFNVGTDNEGLHTLRIGDRDLVLMFEDEDDATRYALLLEAQDFMSPTVEEVSQQEIEDFCISTGYECQLVPKGFVPQNDAERLLMAPPEQNLSQTDWQLDAQPEPASDTLSDANLDRIRRQLEGLL